MFLLDEEGRLGLRDVHFPKKPGNTAKFSIAHMTDRHAGRYHCSYRSPAGLSERSDPLELVVTSASPLRVPAPGSAFREGVCSQSVSLSQSSPGGVVGGGI